MSLLSAFGAARHATKLTNAISGLWRDTVNYMVFKGVEFNLEGSAGILQLAHNLAVFGFMLNNPRHGVEKTNQIAYLTGKNLGEVLGKVWQRQLPSVDTASAIESIVEQLPRGYRIWQKRVLEDPRNDRLLGSGNRNGWIEAAILIFIEDLDSWYSERMAENAVSDQQLTASDKQNIHNSIIQNLMPIWK